MSHVNTRFLCLVFVCVLSVEAKSIGNDSNFTDLIELKDVARELRKLNETIQDEKASRVMFYAVIQHGLHYHNKHSILKFEKVIVNKGEHYDKYDGVFVAPVSGIYLFSWTVTSYSSKYIVTELVVEEKVISTAGHTTAVSGYGSGSMTALCQMEKGDHAWIQTTSINSDNQLYSNNNYPQSSFLGLLIEKE